MSRAILYQQKLSINPRPGEYHIQQGILKPHRQFLWRQNQIQPDRAWPHMGNMDDYGVTERHRDSNCTCAGDAVSIKIKITLILLLVLIPCIVIGVVLGLVGKYR